MSQIDETEKKKNEPTEGYFSDHLHENGRIQREATDSKNGQTALKRLKKDPKSAEIIGKGNIPPSQKGSYRNAMQHTQEQNNNFGTNYKPENVDKIKSKTVGNVSVHAVRDNPSGELFQGIHLKLKDEKVSISNHHFQQNKKGITSKSPLSKNNNPTSSQSNNVPSTGKKNNSQSAFKQKKTIPTNSQGGSLGKASSTLNSQSGNNSVAKPTTGSSVKTPSPSTSSTKSSSKSR